MPDTVQDTASGVSNDHAIENVIAAVGELPASPAIVSTVMGLTSDLDSKVTDISKVLSADQSLTAKVLKLSNSSFYGRSKGVKTLQEAILILGFFTVRSMVVATSAHSMYMKEDKDGSKAKLWQHSLSSAVAARQVAAWCRHPQKEEVFIAALLHDIGKLVLIQKMPQRFTEIVERVSSEGVSFREAEQEALGFSHDQVALVLLEKWSFPDLLCESIRFHHELPKLPESGPPPMSHLISVGNSISKCLGVGFEASEIEKIVESEAVKGLNIDQATLEEIVQASEEQYLAEIGIFEES